MEATISRRVANINDPHLRLEAYLDLVELISRAYGERANPRASYLTVTAEKEGIPEKEYLGSQPADKLREYLKRAKITEIEYSIPGSFTVGNRLWYMQGEGVVMYGEEVNLTCSNLEPEEVRKLQEQVKRATKDYAIQFAGKRICGEGEESGKTNLR